MSKDEIIKAAKEAIHSFDADKAVEVAKKAIEEGVDPVEVIEKGFTVAMREVGDLFDQEKLFLPHVMAAAEAMKAAINELTPHIKAGAKTSEAMGTVVIGTIEGDIHSIGKDIVATMLKIAGFDVYDLGRDVPLTEFVNKAKEVNANIVGSSALMTTTMPNQKALEESLKRAGIREKVKTMVGGAPATQEWADKIGADAYAENASEAILKAKELVTK
jgi:trimethylamine corrinoid protein